MREDALLDTLLTVTPSALAFFDRRLYLVRLNRPMEALLAPSDTHPQGRHIAEVLPDFAPTLTPLLLRVLNDGHPVTHDATYPPSANPDMEQYWRISCHPIIPTREATVAGVLTVFDGLSREEKPPVHPGVVPPGMDEEIRTLVLDTANRVATDILSSETGRDALQHLVEAARALSGARYAALGVARADGAGLEEFITTGLTPQEEAAIGARPVGAGILGLLLRQSGPLRIDALGEHPASIGFPPHHPPMRRFLGVPIRQGTVVLGSLYLTEKENDQPFTEADAVAVETISAHAAVAIRNFQMLKRYRSLLSRLFQAQEEERRAVAYELHDGLTQYVMASHSFFEAFQWSQEEGQADIAPGEFEQGMRYLKAAVVESRRLVNGFRALALENLGLAGSLEQLLEEEKAYARWKSVEFVENLAGRRYDKTLETTVYRVAQEALNNVRKHARTETVDVTLWVEETEAPCLILEVRDEGVGFQPEEIPTDYTHLGLFGMKERVNLLGGTFDIQSAPGKGTTVRAVFPVAVLGGERKQNQIARPGKTP